MIDDRPLRVLAVSHAAVIDVNQEPFAALADDGADVAVVVPRALDTDIRGRVTLTELPGSKARLIPLGVLGGFKPVIGQRGIHLITYRGLRDVLKSETADVVFVEEEPHSVAALQVARESVRFVVHENQNVARRLPPPFRQMRARVLRKGAGVTVRNDTAEGVVRALGFTGPVGRFPHGVDIARYVEPVRRRSDLPRPVIGFVGRLVPEKGIMDLIAAVAAMEQDASLLVVGDGPLRDEARARATQLGIRNEFAGAVPHDEVPQWYASMDLVAVPSLSTRTWKEQFGRIVIEANAAGVPVVVSDSGELAKTVATTAGGAIVREGDVAALTAALDRFCGADDRGRGMGEAGRAAVARLFSPHAIARELHRFLREVART
ncbi:MAG: glycosyltransferase family 4 protein [Actinomycetota bacterium]